MRSLIVAHATTSTNTKILVPEGSVDMNEFEQKWAQPGVAIPYDPTDGAPMPVQPSPLPNELYNGEQVAKQDIDHQLGLYEMMMGNTQAAPQTYKATISLDEFGQRKIKSKLADIEAGLTKLAQVALPLMQELYTTEKVFRVIQPNNSLSEYVINKKLVDDKTGEIMIFNDITIGKYDVIYLAGSTLPSNRYAELEFYMDAYQKGIVDRVEVLKKTEVFDMEGVLQRTDQVGQLQAQVAQATEEIKKLKGDLQTRDRESVNLRKRIEVEKFKTELDGVSNKAKAAGTVYEKRLDDNMAVIKRDIADSIKKETSTPKSGPKGKSKESKKK
jgi:regulator of replication initiation timing